MNPSGSDPDVDAMRRLGEGDDLALNEIMERWTPRISSFLQRQLGLDADALELTQETFVGVYRARHRYRPTARFSTWIFGIAANLARQKLRWRRRHPEVSFEPGLDASGATVPAMIAKGDPGQDAQRKERAAAVRDAVLALPKELREAVVLFEYEDLSHAEIAAIARCSTKAVETRLYRARQQLRERLANRL